MAFLEKSELLSFEFPRIVFTLRLKMLRTDLVVTSQVCLRCCSYVIAESFSQWKLSKSNVTVLPLLKLNPPITFKMMT